MRSGTKKKSKSEVKRVMFAGALDPSKSDFSRGWNGRFLRTMGVRQDLQPAFILLLSALVYYVHYV